MSKKENKEITGTLKHAVWDNKWSIVWGRIHGDVKDRFYDGQWIHTSKVVYCQRGDKPEFIQTLNSRYRVEWADETE